MSAPIDPDEKTGDIDLNLLRTRLEQQVGHRSAATIFSLTGAGLGLLVVLGGFLLSKEVGVRQMAFEHRERDTANQVTGMKAEIAEFLESVRRLEGKVGTSNGDIRLVQLGQRIEMLSGRLEKLEGLFLENPERALSIPLLKKDQEVMEAKFDGAVKLVAKDLEGINFWIKILLSGLGSALAAVIGLVVGNEKARKAFLEALVASSKK